MCDRFLLMEGLLNMYEFAQMIFIFAILFLSIAYFWNYYLNNSFFVYGVGPGGDDVPPQNKNSEESGDDSETITLTRNELQQLIVEQVQKAFASNVINSPVASSSGMQASQLNPSSHTSGQGGGSNATNNVIVSPQNSSSLAHVAFKSPQPLHLQNPNVWFAILEQQFRLANITQESTKFSHAVSNLDARLHNSFADVIMRDKGNTPYTTLKDEVIKSLGESEKTKLHNLLHGLTLGDEKPSQLLAKFRANAGNNFAVDSVKQLWMARLPPQVQIVLTPFENDVSLSVLAKRADDVMETLSQVNSSNNVNHIGNSNNFDKLMSRNDVNETEINAKLSSMKTEILSEISALFNRHSNFQNNVSQNNSRQASYRNRSPSSNRSSSRNRSSSNDRNNDTNVCYYHRRFNDKAQKCVSSCKFHFSSFCGPK